MFLLIHTEEVGGLISFAGVSIESTAHSARLLFAHEVRHKIKLVLPQPEFGQLFDAVQTHFYHQGHKNFLVDEISVYDIGRQHCSRDVGHGGGHVAAAAAAAAAAATTTAAGAATTATAGTSAATQEPTADFHTPEEAWGSRRRRSRRRLQLIKITPSSPQWN